MKTITYRSFLILLFIGNISLAQVGIGTTSPTAALDIASTNDGLLIPRIALAATNVATVTTPTVSELVYNTTTSAAGPNQVTPGYYYWDGTTWIRLSTGSNTFWALTGNAGTVAGTNFIGTTDAIDVRIKTNGTDRWNISNTNNGQLQSYSLGTAPIPAYSFQTDTNTGIFSPSADAIGFATFGIERARVDASGRLVVGATSANAMLDVNSANEGLLIPRVALTATNSALPLTTPTNSEMVFNNANAGTAPFNVTPGYYYWGGASWIRLATGVNNDWALTGNSGTVAGTNFIGTTDAVDVRIKTDGTDRWNISNANNGQLQSYSLGTAALPSYSFQTDTNTGVFSPSADALSVTTNGTERARFDNAGRFVIGAATANAMLDVNSATEGVLIPRVALTATNSASPLTLPTVSEMVYNTATSGVAPNNVVPSYYYWDGAVWVKVATGFNNDWTTTGNAGTLPGTNFVGTTDAADLRIKTGSADRWNISNANNGQLQSYSLGTAALPVYSFQTDTNTGVFSSNPDNLDFATNGTTKLRIPNADQVHALALGTALLPFYSFATDTNTGLFSPAADVLSLSTNGAEGLRMGTTSNVTIGATFAPANAAPANGLRVQGVGVFGKASGEDSRDVVSVHTSSTSYTNFTGYGNATAKRGFASYADAAGIGVLGASNNTGYGLVGLTKTSLSTYVKGNEGVVGQADGSTTAFIPIGVHGVIDETAAGNWKAAGVLGENNSLTPGIGFSGGSYNTANQGASSGVYGNFGSRVPTTSITQNSFLYGVIGDILPVGSGTSIPDTSGGVLGFGGNSNFGILGYRGASGIFYSVYGAGAIGGIALTNNGNRFAQKNIGTEKANNNIGLGIRGGFMGGYIAGSEYGMFSHGREFGAYVQGKTIVNEPIVKLTDNGSSERTATYVPTSTEIDVMTRGRGQLQNGTVFIPFKKSFSESVGDPETINVTVTPTQETKGVFVSRVTTQGFYVTENGSGTSNASFNWVAVGTQNGFENGVEISTTVMASDFDQKMIDVINAEQEKEGKSIHFDGQNVRFERLPESAINYSRKQSPKK
ncbi:hypothetical protein [Flavobacterium sp.]|uniref:beta strand repeat-containing protein n=1 Tax=Flavobacterium sp. TaxID=239 RepID=UPI001228D2E9|nr:hypothetical protein [Flavobacterium sp.]RZJ71600.1 MAG: hypothetical protein EOO49_09585 [Flavobacterium sp.]